MSHPPSNERIDELLNELHSQANRFDIYHGLPTWDEGQLAIMREIVRKWLAHEPGAIMP